MQTIKCPHCGEPVEISEALSHELSDQIKKDLEKQHQNQLKKALKEAEEKALSKAEKQTEAIIKELKESAAEEKERNKKFLEQLAESNKQLRELKRKDEERELELQKKLAKEVEKIREQEKKKADEENSLAIKEKDKKLQDALKQVEEMKRKMQQGSQQTQGEVLELELEELLADTFPDDSIEEVKKGARGADIQHIVKSRQGTECGMILWEMKNYQNKWSDTWVVKLKKDQRAASAAVAVLVSATMPKDAKTEMVFQDGVWICSPSLVVPVAMALRQRLYDVAKQKYVGQNRSTKADMLYDYVTGVEFRQHVEALVEVYQEMKSQIDTERNSFERQWKAREKLLDRFIKNTAVMFGGMQGNVGSSSLPTLKGLDMFELGSGE